MKQNNNHNRTVQKILTSKVPTILENQTIWDIEKLLLDKTKEFETISYIYVIDYDKRLKGVISIKEVFRSPKKEIVKNLLHRTLISVRSHTHQERAAYLALKHKIKSIPVVDKDGVFLGAIPSDTILKTLHYETTEDIMRLGGVRYTAPVDDIFKLSIFKSLEHRLPWLVFGLLGGILAAGIVKSFEKILSTNLILATFIPLIVYMGDAVGTQMEAFIIRDLAINPKLIFSKYFFHQFLIVVLTGMIISLLAYGGTTIIYRDKKFSFIVSLALFCAMISSVFSGLIIPFIFSKLKLDPANASGPIATIIQDIMSITVYFSIAHFLL